MPPATKAPIAPASTSPEPAVAISGVPVGFTITARSPGAATRLAAPFRSTTARLSRTSRRTAESRSA